MTDNFECCKLTCKHCHGEQSLCTTLTPNKCLKKENSTLYSYSPCKNVCHFKSNTNSNDYFNKQSITAKIYQLKKQNEEFECNFKCFIFILNSK